MNYYISEYHFDPASKRTAGSKARNDVEKVFENIGIKRLEVKLDSDFRENGNKFQKLKCHVDISNKWKESLDILSKGDSVIIQFPIMQHSVLLPIVLNCLIKKGVNIVLLIHDLELLRAAKRKDTPFAARVRMKLEEEKCLKICTKIIVHNSKMANYISKEYGLSKDRIVNLQIFDYLFDGFDENRMSSRRVGCGLPVIIAGTLRRHKAEYVYNLPDETPFNLYGVDYEGRQDDYINYFGSFDPDDLPYAMSGSFGLVWDGDSSETCSGAYGDYLRINNPHKTSLYIASGIPVIIWKEAALATFVDHYKCGITVASLKDINDAVGKLKAEDYNEMKKNVDKLSVRLRDGYYTKKAIEKCGMEGIQL